MRTKKGKEKLEDALYFQKREKVWRLNGAKKGDFPFWAFSETKENAKYLGTCLLEKQYRGKEEEIFFSSKNKSLDFYASNGWNVDNLRKEFFCVEKDLRFQESCLAWDMLLEDLW
ncbi:hypothetical protein TNIN_406731 [Trichonephila inaurata madagascariensis]|uniref:Uncharacterized protein n=1 Tax=Trichonephila inaurata madagascariensis TaxID=2747483 RepID=A0A8X6WLN3_9ARAC|nr:hypothetical protein TNIN_406731 [Trichonephila inaurata madagascariensis]